MGSIDKTKLSSGKILKAMRSRFGFTQKEVSNVIGISVSNLSSIENDKRNLGLELAAKFSILYGVRLEALIFPNGIEKMKGYKGILKKVEKLKAA